MIYRRDLGVTILGGLYLKGLIHGGAFLRNFTVERKFKFLR